MRTNFFLVMVLSVFANSLVFSQNADNLSNDLIFSVPKGIYENSFNLILTTNTSVIKYTLDCSEPATSSTAISLNSPAVILIDPESSDGNRFISPAVIVRACSVSPDNTISETITQTYLFVNKVKSLSPNGLKPGKDWPDPTRSSNPQFIDYGLDETVINDTRYKELIDEAFTSIPTISLVTELKNLFDRTSGIYMNAYGYGRHWERPVSMELLVPGNNEEGFQINAGVRMRGGASRSGGNPKHAFRIFFRSEYGKSKLKYPLFGDEGVDEFDNIDLRTSQNYSWSFPGHQGEYNTMNRDVFSRDLAGAMNQPYTRSRYYHLYLNGIYWGIFQSQERSEASYAESYLGGEKEDYDVIKANDNWPASVFATDGNLDAYHKVWDLCTQGFENNANYYKLQGLNEDGSIPANPAVLVDIDNLIDFMLIIFYTGNFDCPITIWAENKSPRNFYTIYNRIRKDGFKFFVHDAEHTIRTTSGEHYLTTGVYENRVNLGSLSNNYKMTVTNFQQFHPQWLHYKLSANEEYRIRFADRAQKYFFNNGCLTPERVTELFLNRAKEIETAIIAESARWGDTYSNPPRNKDDDWLPSINDIVDNYFPLRTKIVLNQLKGADLYPTISAPIYTENGEEITTEVINVEPGYKLHLQKLANTNGAVYYTLDNTDPREVGGTISESAINAGDGTEISINKTTVVNGRKISGTKWSALNRILVFVGDDTNNLSVTEINYHPMDLDSTNDSEFEFIELKNTGSTPINLTGAYFSEGIEFIFEEETYLGSNEYIVLASNNNKFNNRYGFYASEQYSGQLSNSGETLTLQSQSNYTIFSFQYSDKLPWPEEADGIGYSLVAVNPDKPFDFNDPANWRISYSKNGSPGKNDEDPTTTAENYNGSPESFILYQNYPNPFNPTTTIEYNLHTPAFGIPSLSGRQASREGNQRSVLVTLKVYDILGRKVATLVNEMLPPGMYKVEFDASGLSTGLYLYKLQTGQYSKSNKMILLK